MLEMKSLFSAIKIRPTTARDLRGYAFLCACGALWNAVYLYHILQWIYLHGMMDQVESKSFCAALKIDFFGPADSSAIPVLVITERILSRFLFWGGSSIILASYSSKMDRHADGYRLVGFLFFATVALDIMTTTLATGQGHLFLVNSFGTVGRTLTNLTLLLAIAFLLSPKYSLFPRYKVKQ